MNTEMTEHPAQPTSFAERQRDAAVEQASERAAERRRVADLVLGTDHRTRDRLGEVVRIGADYLVEVVSSRGSTWTTVVGERRSIHHWHTEEQALLHLIARRYDDNENSSQVAAHYAARVLRIPSEEATHA